MKSPATETTSELEEECGMRSFVVRLDEFTEVDVVVGVRRDVSVSDGAIELQPSAEVVSNQDLVVGLVRIVNAALGRVGVRL